MLKSGPVEVTLRKFQTASCLMEDCLAGHTLKAHAALYSAAGFELRAGADSPDLLQETQTLLGSYCAETLPSTAWQLTVQREQSGSDTNRPAGLQAIWSGTVPPNLAAVNYVGPSRRRLELVDRGRLDLDLRTRKAAITLAPHVSARLAGYFLMPLLCEGLIQAGHRPIHAACLAVSCNGQSRSALIVAQSGTGKSTTALALANAGWQLMGDDLSLLSQDEGRLTAWGFPRVCHVRRPTLALLPWLNELPLVPTSLAGTFNLPLAALGGRAYGARPQPLEPALIIVLDRPNPAGHQCERLDRAAALVSLAEENVQPIEGCDDANAQTAFARFADLVQQTPAVRLSVGPRLETLADFLRDQTGVGS